MGWSRLVQAGPSWSMLVHASTGWSRLVRTLVLADPFGPDWFMHFKTGPGWSKLSRLVPAGPGWSRMVQIGPCLSRLIHANQVAITELVFNGPVFGHHIPDHHQGGSNPPLDALMY